MDSISFTTTEELFAENWHDAVVMHDRRREEGRNRDSFHSKKRVRAHVSPAGSIEVDNEPTLHSVDSHARSNSRPIMLLFLVLHLQ
ncbi:unnamed protein product [Lasius platythorax]|uniref:Uncharacterized protein n=1 Tax=Lasius platythorax TaxID=488582 RepID=A0AAV2N900_9HYME